MQYNIHWISTAEQLPPVNVEVLVWTDYPNGHTDSSGKSGWVSVAALNFENLWVQYRQYPLNRFLYWAHINSPTK